MINSLVSEMRSRYCEESAPGEWRCKCGAALDDDDCTACKLCLANEREKTVQAEREERRRQWIRRNRSAAQRALAGMPEWPHITTKEAFEAVISDPVLRKVAESYSVERGSSEILSPSGGGKTSVIRRIAERLVMGSLEKVLADPRDQGAATEFELNCDMLWTTGSELVRALREHRLGSSQEPLLFKRAVETRLLFIDELGPEAPQKAGEIFDLIDRRYTKGRVTLVTSGLTVDQFLERYGDAMHRRLTEPGRGFLIDGHKRGANG